MVSGCKVSIIFIELAGFFSPHLSIIMFNGNLIRNFQLHHLANVSHDVVLCNSQFCLHRFCCNYLETERNNLIFLLPCCVGDYGINIQC